MQRCVGKGIWSKFYMDYLGEKNPKNINTLRYSVLLIIWLHFCQNNILSV